MDLLEDVEDVPSFQPQLQSDSEDENSGFNIDVQAISKTFGDSSLDVLARVRQRLAKQQDTPIDEEAEEDDSTLVEPEKSHQNLDNVSFGTSILGFGTEVQKLPQLAIDESDFQTQVIPRNATDATQILGESSPQPQSTQLSKTPVPQPDTQVLDYNDASTQLIDAQQKPSIDSLFLEDEDEDEIIQPLTKEQRLAKITKLAEQKKQERLEREKQLEADITHTSLTDEENDLNDEKNDTVISSTHHNELVSAKQLQEAEEFINIQKRNKDIRPQFERKVVFSKDMLLEAFNESEDDNLGLAEPASSPSTSPLKNMNKPDEFDPRNDDFNLLDLMKSPSKEARTQTRNPIEAYAQSLKRNLLSSPTEDGKINLDSDSDLEITSSPLKHKTAAPRDQIHDKLTIPELTKAEKFVLKSKFSKKKYGNSSGHLPPQFNENMAKTSAQKHFLEHLKKANINQLKKHHLANPNHEILEEMEKDEEVMGTLLEREMERVRNIRKKEKLLERAKAALLSQAVGSDAEIEDEDEEEGDDIVPESESGSDEDEEEDDDEESESAASDEDVEDDDQIITHKKRSKKLTLVDDDDEEEEASKDDKRYDDSYMFGGHHDEDDSIPRDELITTHSSPKQRNSEESSHEDSISASQNKTTEYELFQNLQPREGAISQDSSMNYDASINLGRQLPQFKDTQSTQNMSTQVDLTQADINASTQVDTQAITQILDDTEVITQASVQRGRDLIKNSLQNISENEEDDIAEISEAEDPEITKQRIKEYEDKIRKRELKIRKKRKEMERKGIKNMVEGEALESEDEWQGLGGAEGEGSDVANSEDERMIDNNFNIDLKNEEIRNKFMEEYQIKDQKELEKLLDDIKNHRLTKKVAGNGFDIELSDEEDEILAAYRRQKIAEQQDRMAKNKKLQALSKNEKSKAFFASIQETTSMIKFDDEDDEEEEESKSPTPKDDKEVGEDDQEEEEEEAPVKKTIRVEEAFVQRQLSFLTSAADDDYERVQRLSNFQHGISDDEIEDLHTLKSRSLSNLTNNRSESPIEVDSKRTAEEANLTDVDEDSEFMPSFKKPSIIKSFKSFQEQRGIQIKDGKQHFSGVTISKQYRVASGSKASITYLSRTKAQAKPSKTLKEKNIERSLSLSKEHGKKLFTSGGFD